MRSYRYDHYLVDKPEPSVTNPGGARQTPPVEETKPKIPPSEEGQLHYGRQHARTAELYHKHREEREHAERMHTSEVREEPLLHDKEDVEQHGAPMPDELGRENLKGLARQAVTSVLQAALEAAKGRPLVGAKKLAGDTISGVRRVAREVSARTSRPSSDKQRSGVKAKRPGKKR